MNRNFARIEDGKIKFAPDYLEGVEMTFTVDGEEITDFFDVDHPTAAQYRAAGYLDVVSSPRPADGEGYHYVDGYEIQFDDSVGRDMIYQVWERVEDAPEPPSIEDGMRYLTGGM